MDRLEILICGLKKDMKIKKITQQELKEALDFKSMGTVNNILNLKSASVKSLRKIINYVDNK